MEYQSQNEASSQVLLTLSEIHLLFNNAHVLKNIHFTLYTSEIHAILGEHGAGKSSLCSIISGIHKPHRGKISFLNKSYPMLTLNQAHRLGIEMVCQETQLYDNLDIAHNLLLNNSQGKGIFSLLYYHKNFLKRAEAYLHDMGFPIDPSYRVGNLIFSDKVLIDILRHLYPKPKLLILDEALEKLNAENLYKIVEILHKIKQEGTTILLVTHRIDDIYHLADRVSIIKNGEILLTDAVKNIDKINLIKLAYTQIQREQESDITKQEFYQLLKYNEAILEKLPVNLIVVDVETNIRLINECAKRYFGQRRRFYFNVPLRTLVEPDNLDAFEFIKGALHKKSGEVFYNIAMTIDKQQKMNNIVVYPIYDGEFLIGNIIIIEDITERERLREQVMFSEELASVGLLSAGVAHEINNPLEIMHNYLQYLKIKIQDHGLLNIVHSLEEETDTIAQIVSNLVAFSGDKRNCDEEFDINTLIDNIITLAQFSAEHKRIHIEFEKKSEKLLLKANKTEIKQVILNLMKNSFDAMPDGGEITIKTALREKRTSRYAEVIFQDTGIGISGSNLHDIFLPFYSTKSGEKGNLGLGLSVSYGIITKYQGDIAIKNLDGKGCQFVITIPQE